MTNLKPFAYNDFKKTLIINFESLLKRMPSSKSKKFKKLIEKFFKNENNYEPAIHNIESLHYEISNFVPHNKINTANLNSIYQVIKQMKINQSQPQGHLDSHQEHQKLPQEHQNLPQEHQSSIQEFHNSIIELAKKTQDIEILEHEEDIKTINLNLIELEREKNFLLLHIQNKLAMISTEFDDLITTTLSINDPAELDKTDKRMIKTVIDLTHIINNINVSIRNIAKDNCSQDKS